MYQVKIFLELYTRMRGNDLTKYLQKIVLICRVYLYLKLKHAKLGI